MNTIEITRTLAYPREMVWEALTDADQLAAWLMPNDFRPVVGHRFTFRTDPAPGFDGVVQCEVLELVARERLSFTWRGGPLDTRVTFLVEDAPGGGTRVTVRHEGFAGLSTLIPRIVLGFGWASLFGKKLPAFIAGRRIPAAAQT